MSSPLQGGAATRRGFGAMLAIGLAAALPGCATQVQATDYVPPGAANGLSRPRVVIVRPFAVDPNLVQIDPSVLARDGRHLSDVSKSEKRNEDATDVQAAIGNVLVAQIQSMGLNAEVANAPVATPGAVVIEGVVTEIVEGNETRRLVVGFGAGKSSVKAAAQIVYIRAPGQRELLQSYTADSNSGRMPGLAMGAASSAATGSLAGIGISAGAHALTAPRTAVGREAQRMAMSMSIDLGRFFAQQGWIPPSAVPSPPL